MSTLIDEEEEEEDTSTPAADAEEIQVLLLQLLLFLFLLLLLLLLLLLTVDTEKRWLCLEYGFFPRVLLLLQPSSFLLRHFSNPKLLLSPRLCFPLTVTPTPLP